MRHHRHEDRKDLVGEHPLGDVGQIILLIVFLIVWIMDSFVFRFSTFLAGSLHLFIRLFLAALVLAVGLYLAQKSIQLVFKEERDTPQVIKIGVFAHVRHPMYLASILFYVGLIVATFSLLSLALGILIFFFYNHIAAYEEEMLGAELGEAYKEYKSVVPRWIPRLRV